MDVLFFYINIENEPGTLESALPFEKGALNEDGSF
jgi:hypothetical protein